MSHSSVRGALRDDARPERHIVPGNRPIAEGVTLSRQLELFSGRRATAPAHEHDRLQPTRALARHRACALVLKKVRYTRSFFPELSDLTLRIGLTRRAAGLAEIEGNTLWLNPTALALHTIAHELTHLLQGRGLVPRGERSCDVFALSRDASLVDALPYYLKLPRRLADHRGWLRAGGGRLLHDVAREAVERRQSGTRRYIRWFENEVTRRWSVPPAAVPPRAGAPAATADLLPASIDCQSD